MPDVQGKDAALIKDIRPTLMMCSEALEGVKKIGKSPTCMLGRINPAGCLLACAKMRLTHTMENCVC